MKGEIPDDYEPPQWEQHTFLTPADDPKPVQWPPPGPYWIGEKEILGKYTQVVAWIKRDKELTDHWPKARYDRYRLCFHIHFTRTLPKPDWWPLEDEKEEAEEEREAVPA